MTPEVIEDDIRKPLFLAFGWFCDLFFYFFLLKSHNKR